MEDERLLQPLLHRRAARSRSGLRSTCLWRHFRRVSQISIGVFLLLAVWGAGQQLTTVRHPDKVEATGIRPFLEVESSLQVEGKSYYVFSGPLLFLEAQQYSAHPEQVVLLLPV